MYKFIKLTNQTIVSLNKAKSKYFSEHNDVTSAKDEIIINEALKKYIGEI